MYSIICNATKGRELGIHYLALVDRSKSQEYWWTSDTPEIVLAYKRLALAEKACKRFRHNNPRIVEYRDAVAIILKQQRNQEQI